VLGLGCRLELASPNRSYEVLVNNGTALLGRVEKDGRRVKLCEGGTNIEATWEKLLGALRNSKGRLQ
jgi:hypothetical protein